MSTVAFHTLGCKVNTYETEGMLELFEKAGYTQNKFDEHSDVYVINTCTVTNTGDSKSRQMIRKAKRTNPDAIICVVGCYSQVSSDEVSAIDGVDVVIGTQRRNKIVDYVNEYKETLKPVIDVDDVMNLHEFEKLKIISYDNRTRAFMKIQDGCNKFCTYCIIPYARGGIRSCNPVEVISQAQALVDNGYKEIVLTGIHTAGYGNDLKDYSFYNLLYDLTHKVKGLKRLRISSIEMGQITDEIIKLIDESDIIVDHLHIPIQSGCDKILKRMNRTYTTKEFEDKLNALKEGLPSLSVTTDVIVGFPGESEEDFMDTYNWIKKNHFNQLHVFPYSQRKNTPAASFKEQIPGNVKKERVKRLMDLSDELKTDFAKMQIGNTLEVLFEEEKDGYMVGHASNYLTVKVKEDVEVGEIYTVNILSNDGYDLIGECHEKG